MHHPRQSIDDPEVRLPLKFAGGFGIESGRIGALFTVFSISSMLCQFLVFPPVARYLGVLRCLRISFLIFPFIFFVTPFTALLPTPFTQQLGVIILMMIRGVGGTFAFPTSTILLTNSAQSLRILGTLNGLATSVSAVGRAVGPAMHGSIFTWGVQRGYIVAPFWTLTVISLIASIPTWWLEEGQGFGDDPDSDTEDVLSASASSALSLDDGELDRTPADANDDIASESEYGEPRNLLSYTTTRSSTAIETDDEMDSSEEEAERPYFRGELSSSFDPARSQSQGARRGSRGGRAVRRRSSVPIGMGVGFRRLSTNIGSTGIGDRGPTWGGT